MKQVKQDTGVRYDTPDRYIWVTIHGMRWVVRVEYRGQHWTAVELDEFGGFRHRLYDGRADNATGQ